MTNVKCPFCGRNIRYVVAASGLHAGNNGIIAVETGEMEIITEKGRKARGYQEHTCGIKTDPMGMDLPKGPDV